MTVLYIVGILALLQGIVSFIDGMRSTRHIRRFRPRLNGTPRVVVFCPCRGVDPDFAANMRSIVEQDYPSFTTIFVTDSADDPSYTALKEMKFEPLVAGAARDCGQKVHNLLFALDRAPEDAEVFVFCDSDARYPRHWLRNLVAGLEGGNVAVSTGFRWYVAESGSIPSLLRSAWNASVITMMGAHDRNFAWGGSMALKREVFERIRVRDFWSGTVSDDYGVSRAAWAAGMRIEFVPTCLVPSHGDCDWRSLLEFTTRQVLITRVCAPGPWRTGFVTQTIFNLAFWGLFAAMWTRPAAAALWAGIAGLAAAKSAIRLGAVATTLPEGALSKHRWSYILFAPFVALLYEYNMIRSALTRHMVWRQIHYTLLSPNRTVVRGGAGES
jgi:cellulose synthase/poly-beta-1,6-N-acetylglucosamine synthase-like glycosyltransferase